MNKSESKYFNTAIRMDQALLYLLERKDFAYITVKELCEKAGVNRSTFYLHYETMGDLLTECISYLYAQFSEHMGLDKDVVVKGLHDCSQEELYLITPTYLRPYLEYVREHKRLFRAAIENPAVFRTEDTYSWMFRHVFAPILERFQVSERDGRYMMAFYIHGLMAIITEWLEQACEDSIDDVISVMQRCVMHQQG